MRIGGIASGFDTESIVRDLMKVQRLPLERLNQDKQVWQWRQEDYRGINMKLLSLRNKAFDMRLQSSYISHKIDSSNSNVATATATGNAKPSQYDLNVTRLADRATVASNHFEDNKTLAQLGMGSVSDPGAPIHFSIGSGDKKVEFMFSEDTTWETVMAKFKEQSSALEEAGMRLTVDSFQGKSAFSLVTKETGAQATIEMQDGTSQGQTGNFMYRVFGTPSQTIAGKNAQFTINGMTTERNSNSFSLDGINFTLKEVGRTTLNVSLDTDKAVDNIKAFIDLYNETLDMVYGKLSEERFPGFKPLTEEQREAMGEKEIEKWEEKAKSGLLNRDTVLGNAVSALRRVMTSTVDGLSLNSIFALGMKTGSYQENGKIYIDEAKLRSAIEADPEGVMKLFNNSDEGSLGLARQLQGELDRVMRTVSDRAGSSSNQYDQSVISKTIRNIDEQARRMEERLTRMEDQYWRQFTAMEKALQSMYQQGDWLAQQMMSMSGGR